MTYRGTLALHDQDVAEFDKIIRQSGTTWNGSGNPPVCLKLQLNGGFGPRDPVTGKIGNWMCVHNGYPTNLNYVQIKENLPDTTRELFSLCQKNRLLRGAIQFVIYYQDPQYAAFIDARSCYYLKKLREIKVFWDSSQHETKNYKDLHDNIYFETILFFVERNRADQEQVMDTIYDVRGRTEKVHEKDGSDDNGEEREDRERCGKKRKKEGYR